MNNIIEQIKILINEVYTELKCLPSPQAYKVGGTYYGSTQLFSSVGNHLDLINGNGYTSYGYGCNINYSEMYGIRLGGAYKTDIYKKLTDFLYKHKDEIFKSGWEIINDYGTNFSTYGIAKR